MQNLPRGQKNPSAWGHIPGLRGLEGACPSTKHVPMQGTALCPAGHAESGQNSCPRSLLPMLQILPIPQLRRIWVTAVSHGHPESDSTLLEGPDPAADFTRRDSKTMRRGRTNSRHLQTSPTATSQAPPRQEGRRTLILLLLTAFEECRGPSQPGSELPRESLEEGSSTPSCQVPTVPDPNPALGGMDVT